MQRLTRWGNSTGIRIPAALLESMKLGAGDFLAVRLLDTGDIRLRPVKARQPAEDLAAEDRAQPVHTAAEKW